jgi:hypothetical protein
MSTNTRSLRQQQQQQHRKNGERLSQHSAKTALHERLQDLRECVQDALDDTGMKNARVIDVQATTTTTTAAGGALGWLMTNILSNTTQGRILRVVPSFFIVSFLLSIAREDSTGVVCSPVVGLLLLIVLCWPSVCQRLLSGLVYRLLPTSVATPLHHILAIPWMVTSAVAWPLSKLWAVGGRMYLTIRIDLEIERRRQDRRLQRHFRSILDAEQDRLWETADMLGEGWSAYGPYDDNIDGGLEWQHAVPSTAAGAGTAYDPQGHTSTGVGTSVGHIHRGCSILYWLLAIAVAMTLLFVVGLYEHWSGYAQPMDGLSQVWFAAMQDLSGSTNSIET